MGVGKMFRLMLVSAPNKEIHGRAANDMCFPHLGLLSLGTYVSRKFGGKVEVRVVDGGVISEKGIKEEILNYRPDLLGISVLTPTYESGLEIAKFAKDEVGAKVVLGNDHACFFPKLILERREYVDYIVRNDVGEYGLASLVQVLMKSKGEPSHNELSSVPDLVWRGKGVRENGEVRHELPKIVPEIGLIKGYFDVYVENYRRCFGRFHEREVKPMLMNTARGCSGVSNRCRYCSIYDLTLRTTSPEFFWEVVREYRSKHGINFFFEVADSITSFPLFLRRVVETRPFDPREKGIEFEFYVKAREIVRNPRLLDYLAKLNTVRVNMGMDSGNERMLLEGINKGVHVEENTLAFRLLVKRGIRIHASFVIGAYGETEESVSETIDYIRMLMDEFPEGFSAIELSFLIPLPHSWMWRKMMSVGEFREKYSDDVVDINELKRDWIERFTYLDYGKWRRIIGRERRRIVRKRITFGNNIG